MASNLKKNSYTSADQRRMLSQMLERNTNLASGKFTSSFTFKEAQNQWQLIANALNAIPGATKDWRHWRKTWQDLRSKAKSKCVAQCNYISGTGGGKEGKKLVLDDVDETILNIMGKTVIKGIDVKESVVDIAFNADNFLRTSPSAARFVSTKTSAKSTSTGTATCEPSCSKDLQENISVHHSATNSAAKKLENTIACSTSFQVIAEKKLTMKQQYYKEKLELLKSDSADKKQYRTNYLALQERMVTALEKIANSK